MRHACLFTGVSIVLLALTGCRVESGSGGGSSAFNPATNVDLTFSTFDLTNTSQAPATLSYTRFADFYPGITPEGAGDTAENRATVRELREHVERFIRATPTATGDGYDRVRNPLDLINQVISVGEIDNFDEGRRYIRDRIAQGAAGTYNTRSAGAIIRFTDQAALLAGSSLNDYEWRYPTLDWRYQPSDPEGGGLDDKVYRTIQYVARSVDASVADEQPELISLLAGSRYDARAFSDIGYNQPEYATVDYVSRSFGGIELRQEFAAVEPLDTLFIKSPDEPVIDLTRYDPAIEDTSPDCLRVELNYAMDEVRIYASNEEDARIPDPDENPADYDDPDDIPTVPNPANCTYQPADQALTSWIARSSADRK
ncbi:MAG: hypothetical protein VX939_05100 [Pseudomonadota bacterium]|nr:hypothetical protein [Pseudomonadota bacterium]